MTLYEKDISQVVKGIRKNIFPLNKISIGSFEKGGGEKSKKWIYQMRRGGGETFGINAAAG